MSNKLILKNSIFLYIRLAVSLIAGVLSSRFILKALGAEGFGLYNVVGGIVGMMAFISTMMNATTYRFLAFEQGRHDGDVNSVFNISLTLHLVAAIIVVVLSLTVGLYYIGNHLVVSKAQLSDAYFVFIFSVVSVVGQIIGIPFSGLLIANEKFGITVPIEIGSKLANLAVAILLNYIPSNHLRIYASLIAVVHWLNPIGYILYCVKNYYSTVKWKLQKEIAKYKAIFSFTGWNMLEAAAHVGERQGSAIIINRFFGTVLNASFGIAQQLNSVVSMFANGLGQAVVPQITKSYSAGDHKRASQLVIVASKFSFYLMAIPMLPILLETDFILNVWLTEVPEFTSIFVKAMLIKSIVGTSQYGIAHLINASGNIKLFKILSSGIALMALPLAFIACRIGYPPYYISYIYLLSSVLIFIMNQILLKTLINYDTVEFLIKSTLKIVLVCLMQAPLFFAIRVFKPGLLRFILFFLISEILLITSIYFVGMNNRERHNVIMYSREWLTKAIPYK